MFSRRTRMADGLFVLGDTEEEKVKYFIEVRERALTFKPYKLIIAPKKVVLCGLNINGSCWTPTSYVTSSLARTPNPTTVKKIRRWLGSFKQLSDGIPD